MMRGMAAARGAARAAGRAAKRNSVTSLATPGTGSSVDLANMLVSGGRGATDEGPDPTVGIVDRPLRQSPTSELVRARLVLGMCQSKAVVTAASMAVRHAYRVPPLAPFVDMALRLTMLPHFTGGETEEVCLRRVAQLNERGITCCIDYTKEGDRGEYNSHVEKLARAVIAGDKAQPARSGDADIARSIEAFASTVHLTNRGGFIAIKASALVPEPILRSVSRAIADQHRLPAPLPMPLASFDAGLPPLSDTEAAAMRLGRAGLSHIAKTAQTRGVRVLVDAEQTYLQPAIDSLVASAQRKHNTLRLAEPPSVTGPGDRAAASTALPAPTVFQTYQCYLRGTRDRLGDDLQWAGRSGLAHAAKLVRGAYMYEERDVAADLGYQSFNKGDYKAASKYLEKAVRKAPGNAKYRLLLGDTYFKRGRYSAARKQYVEADELGVSAAKRRIEKVDARGG